ncbi:probable serine/threonine-protein kinase DDB_G0282963 isoform X2 [Musca domestica]|uniref:Probable serine/threonine-protein kinase DDB_G0282963 isoform X2 n=1 Tax=Musca domestica TaxID=7370 RepID=A0ABM3VPY5_MUSDO|nr:probable serine/threonine-protein kinase DDB_G0282963 isoform X2 [Musca domestica]
MSFIHFVALQIEKLKPELLLFTEDFKCLENVSGINIDQISSDITEMDKELKTIENQISNANFEGNTKSELMSFLMSAKQKVYELKNRMIQVDEIRVKAANFFCEDVQKFRLDECFRIFHSFCETFLKSRKDNERRLQLEKQTLQRQKQKQEQQMSKMEHKRPRLHDCQNVISNSKEMNNNHSTMNDDELMDYFSKSLQDCGKGRRRKSRDNGRRNSRTSTSSDECETTALRKEEQSVPDHAADAKVNEKITISDVKERPNSSQFVFDLEPLPEVIENMGNVAPSLAQENTPHIKKKDLENKDGNTNIQHETVAQRTRRLKIIPPLKIRPISQTEERSMSAVVGNTECEKRFSFKSVALAARMVKRCTSINERDIQETLKHLRTPTVVPNYIWDDHRQRLRTMSERNAENIFFNDNVFRNNVEKEAEKCQGTDMQKIPCITTNEQRLNNEDYHIVNGAPILIEGNKEENSTLENIPGGDIEAPNVPESAMKSNSLISEVAERKNSSKDQDCLNESYIQTLYALKNDAISSGNKLDTPNGVKKHCESEIKSTTTLSYQCNSATNLEDNREQNDSGEISVANIIQTSDVKRLKSNKVENDILKTLAGCDKTSFSDKRDIYSEEQTTCKENPQQIHAENLNKTCLKDGGPLKHLHTENLKNVTPGLNNADNDELKMLTPKSEGYHLIEEINLKALSDNKENYINFPEVESKPESNGKQNPKNPTENKNNLLKSKEVHLQHNCDQSQIQSKEIMKQNSRDLEDITKSNKVEFMTNAEQINAKENVEKELLFSNDKNQDAMTKNEDINSMFDIISEHLQTLQMKVIGTQNVGPYIIHGISNISPLDEEKLNNEVLSGKKLPEYHACDNIFKTDYSTKQFNQAVNLDHFTPTQKETPPNKLVLKNVTDDKHLKLKTSVIPNTTAQMPTKSEHAASIAVSKLGKKNSDELVSSNTTVDAPTRTNERRKLNIFSRKQKNEKLPTPSTVKNSKHDLKNAEYGTQNVEQKVIQNKSNISSLEVSSLNVNDKETVNNEVTVNLDNTKLTHKESVKSSLNKPGLNPFADVNKKSKDIDKHFKLKTSSIQNTTAQLPTKPEHAASNAISKLAKKTSYKLVLSKTTVAAPTRSDERRKLNIFSGKQKNEKLPTPSTVKNSKHYLKNAEYGTQNVEQDVIHNKSNIPPLGVSSLDVDHNETVNNEVTENLVNSEPQHKEIIKSSPKKLGLKIFSDVNKKSKDIDKHLKLKTSSIQNTTAQIPTKPEYAASIVISKSAKKTSDKLVSSKTTVAAPTRTDERKKLNIFSRKQKNEKLPTPSNAIESKRDLNNSESTPINKISTLKKFSTNVAQKLGLRKPASEKPPKLLNEVRERDKQIIAAKTPQIINKKSNATSLMRNDGQVKDKSSQPELRATSQIPSRSSFRSSRTSSSSSAKAYINNTNQSVRFLKTSNGSACNSQNSKSDIKTSIQSNSASIRPQSLSKKRHSVTNISSNAMPEMKNKTTSVLRPPNGQLSSAKSVTTSTTRTPSNESNLGNVTVNVQKTAAEPKTGRSANLSSSFPKSGSELLSNRRLSLRENCSNVKGSLEPTRRSSASSIRSSFSSKRNTTSTLIKKIQK